MRTKFGLGFGSLAIAVLLLTACGGSSDDSDIASLSDGDSETAAGSDDSGTATEEELLAYVECLREQGLDVPDPQVDADGNLQLGGGPGGGPAGQDDDSDDSAEAAPEFDRDAFAQAQEECGSPPGGAIGGFADIDQSEFQDAALAMAQCLRDKGYDVDDPDLGNFGPGANNDAEADDDDEGGPPQGGFFGDLDLDDPDVQANVEECRDSAFAGLDLPQGGPGGGGPGGGGPGGGGPGGGGGN